MRIETPWIVALALLVSAGAAAQAPPAAPPPGGAPAAGPDAATSRERRVERASSAIAVDGRLDEPAWRDAEAIPLDYEYFPGENVAPPVATEAFVTFDDGHVYVAFRCHDPDPSSIRANLMDRDSIETFVQDDHVVFMIDTFNDERRAFQFRVNPLGVQADAVFAQAEGVEDFSWDAIWASAGRIFEGGYVIEVAIPVAQLRFPPGDGPQTWGWELSRSYPRSARHRISSTPRDRANNCLLCQVEKLTGFEDLQAGRNLELVPTLTAGRTDRRSAFPEGSLDSGEEDFEPGFTARWGLSPGLTLNATANPDFSQVEADAAQLAVNERFALFFPEKRPFFLEGIDFFATPLNVVFTRTVVDPEVGVKLTGKRGRHGGGVFATRDEVNSLVIPSNQGSSFALLDQPVDAGVLRYRRDLGSNSSLGVLYAGRDAAGYHNHVGGVDGFFRLSATDQVRVQYLRSDTRYPESVAERFGQESGAFGGDALRLTYDHRERDWFVGVRYDDLDPGFRADSGFIPRVDVRTAVGNAGYLWYGGADDRWDQTQLSLSVSRTEDHGGRLTDEGLDLQWTVNGPRQSFLLVSLENNTQFFRGTLHEDMRRAEAFLELQPAAMAKTSLYVDYGETVDFANNQPADILVVNPSVELKPGRHVNLQASHVLQRLDVDGGRLSEANLTQLRTVYNFSVRSFIRAVVQYTAVERDPGLFVAPVAEESEQLFTQLLFSYKVNPQTVLFLGYSDNHLGLDQGETRIDLTQADRTFFFKVGYAWLL